MNAGGPAAATASTLTVTHRQVPAEWWAPRVATFSDHSTWGHFKNSRGIVGLLPEDWGRAAGKQTNAPTHSQGEPVVGVGRTGSLQLQWAENQGEQGLQVK